jgi:outer membrane protein assembly factor BamB
MRRLTAVVATVLVVLGLFAQPVAAVTTSITLKPSFGPPTTKVSVNGTGFGASETVNVYFSAARVATVPSTITTTSTGTFTASFTVPASALPGKHAVMANGQTSLLSASQNFLVRTNWAKFHFDLNNSGFNPYENVIGASNVSGLKTAWTGNTGYNIFSSPAVANGVIYVGATGGGKFYAFSADGRTNCTTTGTPPVTTCTPLWIGATAAGVDSSPTVANGVVYVGTKSPDDKLYAFSTSATSTNCTTTGTPPVKTCTPLWTGATGYGVNSSPAVANGVVYVGSLDGKLYAFSTAAGSSNCTTTGTPPVKTCTPLWTATIGPADRGTSSSPSVANGVVYIGSAGKLYAFSAAAGSTNCITTGTPPAKTCTPLWTGATGNAVFSSPAVANGVVYVGSEDKKLYAFSAAAGSTNCITTGTPPVKTCTPLWTGATTGLIVDSSPAVANGLVYVGSFDYKLYAFSAAAGSANCTTTGTPPVTTCTPLWTGATGYVIDSSPAVANGVVYVGSGDGKLYAFGAAAGSINCTTSGTPPVTTCTPLRTVATGSQVNSSPAVANGVVYVGSYDGKLYAFSH